MIQIRNLLAATLLFSVTLAAVPALAATHETAKKPTTTTLKGSGHSFVLKQEGKLTVTVTPRAASGTAYLFYRKLPSTHWLPYGTIAISGGLGTGYREAKEVGHFAINAVYGGSKSFKSSISNTVTSVVTK
jgi:hypothetical protein